MIAARSRNSAAAFIESMRSKAESLGAARGETILRESKRDPWRWRDARLLWPLFTSNSAKG